MQGEPVAYILGQREFWSLLLHVNDSTLIPRPDTETLVEHALQLCLEESLTVLDLGTGTGAIAAALAVEHPQWHIEAVDCEPDAVELAELNMAHHQLTNVQVYTSDWFSRVPEASLLTPPRFGLTC
jgi:release factor glutamine methyltransferase